MKTLLATTLILISTSLSYAGPHNFRHNRNNYLPYIFGGAVITGLGAAAVYDRYYRVCALQFDPIYDEAGRVIGHRKVRVCE
jgi:hypothetical protein